MKLLLLILFFNICFAQNNVFIEQIDISELPTVKAKIYSFTGENTPDRNLSENDFRVSDQFADLDIISYNFPEQELFEQNNILFYIDLKSIDAEKINNLKTIINNLEDDNTSISVVGFDRLNYVYQYFNLELDLGNLDKLITENHSDINDALSFEFNNPIDELNSRQGEKNLVVISDTKLPIIDFENINQRILNNNINLIFVNENFNASVDDLTNLNNGSFYQGDLQQLNKLLISKLKGYSPAELIWEISGNCDELTNGSISLEFFDASASFEYSVPEDLKLRFESLDFNIEFDRILPGDNDSVRIHLTAKNGDINIYSLKLEDDFGGVFRIDNEIDENSDPVNIAEGSEYNIALEYFPADSSLVFTRILIESDACEGNVINILGGFPNVEPNEPTLKLIKPECGETLVVGDVYEVQWEGLLPDDIVQLEYSTNGGNSWEAFATNVNGLNYNWTVPDIESDDVLVRVVQFWPNNIGETEDLNHLQFVEGEESTNFVNAANFNPEGNLIITGSQDGKVRLWSSLDGSLVRQLDGHDYPINWATFSKDGKYAASCDGGRQGTIGGRLIVWNADPQSDGFGDIIQSKVINDRSINKFDFSPSTTEIIMVYVGGRYVIFDYLSDEVRVNIPIPNESNLRSCKYTNDGQHYFIGGSRNFIYKYSSDDNQQVFANTYKDGLNIVRLTDIAISPDDKLVSYSEFLNGSNRVFDVETGDFKYEVDHIFGLVSPNVYSSFFFYSSTDSLLLTCGGDYLTGWDAHTGDSLAAFREHASQVNNGNFNFDGSLLVTSSNDGLAKIWKLNEYDLQTYTTDCPLTIINAVVDGDNVVLNESKINQTVSSTISSFLENMSNGDFTLNSISIEGQDKNAFQLKRNYNSYSFTRAKPIDLEVDFTANRPGDHNARIIVELPTRIEQFNITGTGIDYDVIAKNQVIDFGRIEIGNTISNDIIELIENISSREININSATLTVPDNDNFSGYEFDPPNRMQTNEIINGSFRFSADQIRKYNAKVDFQHDGVYGSTKVLLLGESVPFRKDTIIVSIDDFEANAGDRVTSQLSYDFISEEGLRPELEFFDVRLSFNSTLLIPEFSSEADITEDNVRYLDLLVPVDHSSRTGDVLLNLNFQATLGNDSTTTINIERFLEIPSFPDTLGFKGANFRLLDLCYEGGARLVENNGEFLLQNISPNPVMDDLEISFELVEEGFTKLYLINAKGGVERYLLNQKMQPGKYSSKLSSNQLIPGNYLLILETPTLRSTKKLVVQK